MAVLDSNFNNWIVNSPSSTSSFPNTVTIAKMPADKCDTVTTTQVDDLSNKIDCLRNRIKKIEESLKNNNNEEQNFVRII